MVEMVGFEDSPFHSINVLTLKLNLGYFTIASFAVYSSSEFSFV